MSNEMYSNIGRVIPPKMVSILSKMYVVRQIEALIRALQAIQKQLNCRKTQLTLNELSQYHNQLDYYQTVYFNIELAASEISSVITEAVHLKMDLGLRVLCCLRANIWELREKIISNNNNNINSSNENSSSSSSDNENSL